MNGERNVLYGLETKKMFSIMSIIRFSSSIHIRFCFLIFHPIDIHVRKLRPFHPLKQPARWPPTLKRQCALRFITRCCYYNPNKSGILCLDPQKNEKMRMISPIVIFAPIKINACSSFHHIHPPHSRCIPHAVRSNNFHPPPTFFLRFLFLFLQCPIQTDDAVSLRPHSHNPPIRYHHRQNSSNRLPHLRRH